MAALNKMLAVLDQVRDLEDRNLQNDLLIEMSERFKSVPETVAKRPFQAAHRVPACESEAYVWCVMDDAQKLKFYFAVENPHGVSAKALSVFLDENLSGLTAAEIAGVSEEIVYDLFGKNVSMGKGQGLMGMVRMLKALAREKAR